MPQAQLYFLSDQYYQDFPDDKLMQNKDMINGAPHSRPCFFAFKDYKIADIYWIVPISSRFEKFKRIEQEKISKYGHCSTIRFGTVLGRNTAFLIQNMCPATRKYLTAYIDKNNCPVRIDDRVAADVEKNARHVLAMAKRGAKVIFPDVFKIYQGLEQQLQQKTIDYYNQHAEQFAKRTEDFDMSFCQDRFMKYLPEQALILDAGCGSGRDAKVFLEKGFRVCAMDASETMCRVAEQRIGQPVTCMRFEEMEWQEYFDGIWACASLLHVARHALPAVLENFCRALKPGGILYASFKNGDGEEERLGRFFNDYRMEELKDAFLRGGMFELVESFETEDVRPDYKDKPWVNIIVRKICE